jgi:hypothetical protein
MGMEWLVSRCGDLSATEGRQKPARGLGSFELEFLVSDLLIG